MTASRWSRGYTTGVFDLFHFGHLNLLRNARSLCDELVVGVSTDELVFDLKGKLPAVPFEERLEIVRSIRYVDHAIPEHADDKVAAANVVGCDVIFKGSDWRGTEKWEALASTLRQIDVDVHFLDYTTTVSSTLRRAELQTRNESASS